MSDETPQESPDVAQATSAQASDTPKANVAEAQNSEPKTPEAQPAGNPLEAELAAAKERYIRLLADFDNMRKRQARELEERTARANERLVKALMPVFDHFEMALASVQEQTKLEDFIKGVEMIAGDFRKVLEQEGSQVIEAAEGADFDPMQHEALAMVPNETIPQGKVISQFRKGWKLGDKIIRPAQVVVSAGASVTPPKEA